MALRVLHFVTGGFSGATRVAIDLVGAHNPMADMVCLLVLRQKKTTTATHLQQLQQSGIPYHLVSGATHWLTIYQLMKLCISWKPDVLVTHGFPEHLLGRWAGLWAKVPHLVQVEHNSRERYTWWKLIQSRWLSHRTDKVIAVSEGVAGVLAQQGLYAPIQVITNGIDTQRFGGFDISPIATRPHDLVMVARFAKSKDQATVVRALHILQTRGMEVKLTLVGSGSRRYRHRINKLVAHYGLESQIVFIEHSGHVERILAEHKIFVMASFFEGLNLSVLEAMASGCLVIGSDVVGVAELIQHGRDGFLFRAADAEALADLLQPVLNQLEQYQPQANAGRQKIQHRYDKQHVNSEYYRLFNSLLDNHQYED